MSGDQTIAFRLPRLVLWQGTAAVTGILSQIILARSLGPHDKGILDLFLLVPVIISSIADLGLLAANTYFSAKHRISVATLHANSVVWAVGSGVLILAVFLGAGSVSPFASLTPELVFASVVLSIPLLYFSLWSGLMLGTGQVASLYRLNGLVGIITVSAYLVVLSYDGSLRTMLIVSGGMVFLKAVVAFTLLPPEARSALSPGLKEFRECLVYGLPLFIGVALNVLHFRLVQFLVESMIGPAGVGYLNIAVRVSESLWLLDFVIINASVFRLTSGDRETAVRLAQRMTRAITLMAVISAAGVGFASPVLLPFVFGADFIPAITPLLWLLPGTVAWSIARSLAQFMSYHLGRPWLNTSVAMGGFVLNLTLNLLLIPVWDLSGAAIATTISYTATLVGTAVIFKRMSGEGLKAAFMPQKQDFRLLKAILQDSVRFGGSSHV